MTLEIKVSAHVEFGPLKEQVEEAMAALGFTRTVAVLGGGTLSTAETVAAVRATPPDIYKEAAETILTNTPRAGESEAQTAARRERGKPASGRARRTKEEIAEDEAADKADATNSGTGLGISSGEERVGPEDDAETQAQDEADEQAEVDANRDAEAPLTIEDLKMAMSEYVTKFDMGAAQEDGVNIFGDALGKPPGGEQFWKMSIAAAAGQDTLKKAIAAWKAAATADKRYAKVG
jgi:hypothetical protein